MFTASDVVPQRRKGQGKTNNYEIAAKVVRDENITITFDKPEVLGRHLVSMTPSLIVRLAFTPRIHLIHFTIPGKM